MSDEHEHPYTTASAFFEALWDGGVRYVFGNFGSDHPAILDAILYGQRHRPHRFPKIITCPHEMVAMSMADGYARLTGTAQAVIVHVDVGTQALGPAFHNASSGRAPVFVFAGMTPFTAEGELRGSRSEFINWLQDVPDQRAICAQYCRYTTEIRTGRNAARLVRRALQAANSEPKGPVYVTAAREVMEETLRPRHGREESAVEDVGAGAGGSGRAEQDSAITNGTSELASPEYMRSEHWSPAQLGELPASAAKRIASALLEAQKPFIVAGFVGRRGRMGTAAGASDERQGPLPSPLPSDGVRSLVALADLLPNSRVYDCGMTDMTFPATHPACVTPSGGRARAAIQEADVILVLDADVPWIPTSTKPRSDARIFHVDVDPLKLRMQLFYIPAEERFLASTALALAQLETEISTSLRGNGSVSDRSGLQSQEERETEPRRSVEHREHLKAIEMRARQPESPRPCTVAFLGRTLREALPPHTIWVSEAVTSHVQLADQLRASEVGSFITKGGGGLGWNGGAALGAKLAAEDLARQAQAPSSASPSSSSSSSSSVARPFVCNITGDGSYMFSVPSSVAWIAARYGIPVLTVVLNNGGWRAPKHSAGLLRDPSAPVQAASLDELGVGFGERPMQPRYAGIAVEASAGWMEGASSRVERAEDFLPALDRARRQVEEDGRGAVLDVWIE